MAPTSSSTIARPSPELSGRPVGWREPVEPLENPLEVFFRDARAVVVDVDRGPVLVEQAGRHRHTRSGVLQSVFDQIGYHLSQAVRVRFAEELVRKVGTQLDVEAERRCHRLERVRRLGDDRRQVDRATMKAERSRLELGQLEQIL